MKLTIHHLYLLLESRIIDALKYTPPIRLYFLVISHMINFTYTHGFRGEVPVLFQALCHENIWGVDTF
jgi:hypothetical protein